MCLVATEEELERRRRGGRGQKKAVHVIEGKTDARDFLFSVHPVRPSSLLVISEVQTIPRSRDSIKYCFC